MNVSEVQFLLHEHKGTDTQVRGQLVLLQVSEKQFDIAGDSKIFSGARYVGTCKTFVTRFDIQTYHHCLSIGSLRVHRSVSYGFTV